jgi:hypothetical protein
LIVSLWEGPAGVVDAAHVEHALIEATAEPEATVRLSVVRGLGAVGPKLADDPPPALLAALEDASDKVRAGAAGALDHILLGLDPYMPELLLHAALDPDRAVRDICAYELEDFVKPTAVTPTLVPILTKALESPTQNVCCAACGLLAKLGPASTPAIPRLRALAKNATGTLRQSAQHALSKLEATN